MGLIKNEKGHNISISSLNGYSVDRYWIAKDYLHKVGTNRRNLDVNELIKVYNTVKQTNVSIGSCKPCSVSKYYNGLQNYVKYCEILFKANGIDYSRTFVDEKPVYGIDKNVIEVMTEAKEVKSEPKAEIKPKKKAKKEDAETDNRE